MVHDPSDLSSKFHNHCRFAGRTTACPSLARLWAIHYDHNDHDDNVDHGDPVDYSDHVDHGDHIDHDQRVAYRIGNLSNADISDFFVYRIVYRIEPPISNVFDKLKEG